jgi:hypothetical protein
MSSLCFWEHIYRKLAVVEAVDQQCAFLAGVKG